MSELTQAKQELETANYFIELKEAMDRLRNNRDWKLIIEDDFFAEYTQQTVANLIHANPEVSAMNQKHLLGVSCFRDYLNSRYALGVQSEDNKQQLKQTIDELMTGE